MNLPSIGVSGLVAVGGGEHAVHAEQEEDRAVERIDLRVYLAIAAPPLDLSNQQDDHRMVGPVVVLGPRRREVQREKLFEEQPAELSLEARHQRGDLGQRGTEVVGLVEEPASRLCASWVAIRRSSRRSTSSSTCSLVGKWK